VKHLAIDVSSSSKHEKAIELLSAFQNLQRLVGVEIHTANGLDTFDIGWWDGIVRGLGAIRKDVKFERVMAHGDSTDKKRAPGREDNYKACV
jgi:hypothetical protein